MIELQNNMATTIHLEALKITTAPVLEQLARKIHGIEKQYEKELAENEFKALQRNEEFIRLILSCLNDYDTAIAAISLENQQLREARARAFEDKETWRLQYIEQGKQHMQLIDVMQAKLREFSSKAA